SSVKRITEHRQIKGNPVDHDKEFNLRATGDKTAPITLVRLILAGGAMTEKQICYTIFQLAIFSGALAIITAFLMGVKI
ncbi:MAG: UDP-N-acetylglucosamine-1-phosphate transferase, partial [Candidatus Nitrosomaritimum yanchengensis]